MKLGVIGVCTGLVALATLAGPRPAAAATGSIVLTPVSSFRTGSAEISAYDPVSKRLFVLGGAENQLSLADISQPWQPRNVQTISLASYGGGVNSVAVQDGVVAVAVESVNRQTPGKVVFFNPAGAVLSTVTVGAVPDMVTFTPDGSYLLVANEGEPLDYCTAGPANDPEGSVSVIDLRGGVANLTQANVRTAGFAAWNGAAPAGVRIFGPNASVAQDLEPEYLAVSPDSRTAYVTLQENNALATVDIASATVTALVALGTKDHAELRNAIDASDRDEAIRIIPRQVQGMYQPDAMAAYRVAGQDYLVMANEGDARDYECFGEETRVGDLTLNPSLFPNASALQESEELGRLRTTTANGDLNDDGEHDVIYAFGGRSFSIRTAAGELVYDSGSDFELITAALFPQDFNSSNDENGSGDSRSDDKGPEPEGLTVASFRGREYAFIALERVGGVMVYDVTDPRAPSFVQYANTRDFSGDAEAGTAGDLGAEGVLFIPREESPIARALLVVSNELSGTVTIYSVKPRS